MTMENSAVEEQKIETLHIKNEVLDTDYNSHFLKEDQVQLETKEKTMIEETGVSKYECDACDIFFTDECAIKDHNNKFHDGDSNLLVPNKEQQQLYDCDYPNCGKSFKTKQKITEHEAVHSDKKPFKCKQTGCTKSFKRKRDLYGHIKAHSDEKPFKCGHEGCDKSFKAKNNLKAHLRLHSDDTPFKCSHDGCGREFKTKFNLVTHQRTHLLDSNSVELLVCDFPGCNSRFRWQNSHYRHMQKHLKNHMRNQMGKRFSCVYEGCGKSYARKDTLAAHLRSHKLIGHENYLKMDENGDQKVDLHDKFKIVHQCSDCKATFREENEFENHIKCCGRKSAYEFVDVDQIKTDDVTDDVDLK